MIRQINLEDFIERYAGSYKYNMNITIIDDWDNTIYCGHIEDLKKSRQINCGTSNKPLRYFNVKDFMICRKIIDHEDIVFIDFSCDVLILDKGKFTYADVKVSGNELGRYVHHKNNVIRLSDTDRNINCQIFATKDILIQDRDTLRHLSGDKLNDFIVNSTEIIIMVY